MTDQKIQIGVAKKEDAEELLEIYTPYVEKTAITFEYEVPDVETFKGRISNTLQKYPYLLAKQEGEILGYAYTGAFVGRAAYGWAAEVSIYLREDKRRMGIGKKLYTALEAVSKAQHILNLNACIGKPEAEDQYLNRNSILFHTHMGYAMVGEFHKCGYKFGNWYNMVWMEKKIGRHDSLPAPVIAFPDLSGETLRKLEII